MKFSRWIPIFAAGLFGTGCGVCDPLGPPCADVSVRAARVGMAGDILTIRINGEPQSPPLSDAIPDTTYYPEVQTERRRGYRLRDDGIIYVAAWSENLGVLSRTKQRRAYTDRVTSFEFRRSDFRR